jgi:hypothetical protein
MSDFNPYAAPACRSDTASGAELLRRKYLQREACVKGLAFVFFGIAAAYTGAAILVGSSIFSEHAGARGHYGHVIAGLVFGILTFRIGLGLRRLERRAQLAVAMISAGLLILFPLGTALAFWLFHQLLSQKGSVIFSELYQEIIAQTPGISPRLSWPNLLLLALVMLFAWGGTGMYAERLL